MKKTFTIQNIPSDWTCTVEVDEDFLIGPPEEAICTTKDLMRDMIMFWSGGKFRLWANAGDVLKTFLQQLGREVFMLCSNYGQNCSANRVIADMKDMEGWAYMDGSQGIKITHVDMIDINHEEFDIEEVEV